MKLVIVESPAKAKTIKRYLGKGFSVAATVGHIKDLPKSKLGVDVEKKYKPDYQVMPGKKKVISKLRKKIPRNDQNVYIACDPDREGEAIAKHVAEVFKLKKPHRVVFHEITKDAVNDAIENPRTINMDLVNAQKARRILDRLVGYKLSELLWRKIWYGLSAGRVQSVATRLIVEREREREEFKPEEYWELFANCLTDDKQDFRAEFKKRDGKKYVPGSKKEVDDLLKDVKDSDWSIKDVETKKRKQNAPPPFTTAKLQQLANNYLGYSASRTMQLAQQLYQGIDVKEKGHVGLITYMRTDSVNLAKQAINAIRKFVKGKLSDKYVPEKPNYFKAKSRLAQEAHEAIRPTHFDLPPEKVKDSLSPQQYKLYKLIWDRAVSCQMKPMEYNAITAEIETVGKSGKKYTFVLKGTEVTFDGYAKVAGSSLLNKEDAQQVSGLEPGEDVKCKKIDTEQKFTKPKARYTEATLVKELEKHGIGRPSTYASIISTIQNRGYVDKDGRYLLPTDVGFVVTDFLMEHFDQIVDYDFTSEVEENLDNIAEGKEKWVEVVDDVYKPFDKTLEKKKKEVDKKDVVILGDSDKKCPECGGKMVVRLGRNGKFLSCAKFPECKGMLGMDGKKPSETLDYKKYEKAEKCPDCGAKMVLKTGKYGKFWACSKYPDCKGTAPLLLKEKCPECGSNLVERKGKWGKFFTGCSGYPKCKYIKKTKKKKGKGKGKSKSKKTKKSKSGKKKSSKK